MCHAGDTGDLFGAALSGVIAIRWAKGPGDREHRMILLTLGLSTAQADDRRAVFTSQVGGLAGQRFCRRYTLHGSLPVFSDCTSDTVTIGTGNCSTCFGSFRGDLSSS